MVVKKEEDAICMHPIRGVNQEYEEGLESGVILYICSYVNIRISRRYLLIFSYQR
jgi:hypothetical protein